MKKELSNKRIELCSPNLDGNELAYLNECIETGWVSSVGPFVKRFEQDVAEVTGTKYAVAVASGTAALHTALLVAGIGQDDEVFVNDLTFIAPANAIRYVGAWPIFIDIEPKYFQMDVNALESFISKKCKWVNGELYNSISGRRIKGVLPVHILGHPVDMDPLSDIARKYNLVVVEDAAESLGAKYKDKMVGHLGDIACLSFNGNKIITSGGGGMILTDNSSWAEKARYLTTQAKSDPVEYRHEDIGYNYRLSNLHAAVGCAQLEKIKKYVSVKRRIASIYTESFENVDGIRLMAEAPWAQSTFWMYTVLVDEIRYGMNSRALREHLSEKGIESRSLWQPLHNSPAHRGSVYYGDLIADEVNAQALSLPSSVWLTNDDQLRVIDIISNTKCK